MKPYIQYKQNGKPWKAGKTIYGLCAAYNHATNPSKLMTQEEHERSNIYARAIRNRIKRLGFRYGIHYSEMANGAWWPSPLKSANA